MIQSAGNGEPRVPLGERRTRHTGWRRRPGGSCNSVSGGKPRAPPTLAHAPNLLLPRSMTRRKLKGWRGWRTSCDGPVHASRLNEEFQVLSPFRAAPESLLKIKSGLRLMPLEPEG